MDNDYGRARIPRPGQQWDRIEAEQDEERGVQAYHLDGFGDPKGIVLRESPAPAAESGEVLVRLRAASINYRDLMVLQRTYPVPASPGTIPLSDGAGEVVAVGPGITRFTAGDRVAGLYFPRWQGGRLTADIAKQQLGSSHDGMLAECRALPQDALVRVPYHLSFEEAATLPCAALAAWSAVTGGRPVVPGEGVLVVGTGGVGLFAIQFAAAHGARVLAVTSRQDKTALLRRLGAIEVLVSSDRPDWDAEVVRITGGHGVEHVVDAVGPATLARSIRACALDAEVALAGVFQGEDGFDARVLAGRLVTIRRVAVGSRTGFEAMSRAIARHELRPVIDRVFPFAEAPDAYRHFAAMRHVGKVVVAGAP